MVQEVRAPDQEVVQKAVPTEIRQVVNSQVAILPDDDDGKRHAQPERHGLLHGRAAGDAYQHRREDRHGPERRRAIGNLNDAVFTCFAPADNPQIAVGVIVKGGGFGAAAAAPIAVKIIEAFLGQQ